MDSKILSIIIPIFNEVKTIELVLERIEEVQLDGVGYEVILVDDGSTDGTRELLAKLREKHKVILLDRNYGKGAAVKRGILASSGDLTGTW
ncbi:MAG: hypothetical protein KatS3mg087_1462 [Patescibacteria group bacterium]|nr:MAG: hypothetical protein KatS3mg087_1462 [Patescibacteria group bacterium]